MDRYAVMVDAGYFLRQSLEVVSARASTKRSHLDITDPAGLISLLLDKSKATLNLSSRELLRVYWYDGVMATGLTIQQRSIVEIDDVHFRAGTVNSAGQQKGVDSLIVTDLIELAANHAICDAALITGDSDLAVGIELAQKKGVRIAVIGIEDLSAGVSHNQSFEITSRADRVARIGGTELATVMRYVPPVQPQGSASPQAPQQMQAPAPAQPVAPAAPAQAQSATPTPAAIDKASIERAVKTFIGQQASLTGAVDPSTKRIDSQVDRTLIHHVFIELAHGALSTPEKNYARQVLRSELGV